MSCVLCLDSKKESTIDLFSAEGKDLDVQNILKQHFWMIHPNENDEGKFICIQCWCCVFEFHQFYIQIQRIHEEFNELKVSEDPISNEFFESEFKKAVNSNLKKQNGEQPLKDSPCKKPGSSRNVTQLCSALNESPIDAKPTTIDESLNVDILASPKKKATKKTFSKKDNFRKSKNVKIKPELNNKKRVGRPPKKCESNPKLIDTSIELAHDDDFQNDFEDTNEKLKIEIQIEKNIEKNVKSIRRDLSHFDEFIKENIKLSCALCEEPCDNFSTLQTHFRIEHNCLGYIICCGKKLLKRGVLVDHLYTHKDPEYFKCNDCGKVLADRRCLELHKQTHEQKREKKFKCEICSKMFHLKPVFRRHVESHVPKELREFECSQCSKRFASKCLMNNHMRIVHLNKYSQVCDICGKKIRGRETFRLHQQQHKGKPQELLNCDICGVTVTSKYGLRRHQRVKHTEKYQTPQQCKYCSKISPNITALSRHIYYMHSLEKKHQCSLCDKAFKRPKDLKFITKNVILRRIFEDNQLLATAYKLKGS